MKKIFFAAFAMVFALLAAGCGWNTVSCSIGWSEGNAVPWKDTTLLDGQYAGVRTIRVAQSIFPVRVLPSTSDSVSVVCYAGQIKVNVPDYKIGVRQDGGVLEIYQTPRTEWFADRLRGATSNCGCPSRCGKRTSRASRAGFMPKGFLWIA